MIEQRRSLLVKRPLLVAAVTLVQVIQEKKEALETNDNRLWTENKNKGFQKTVADQSWERKYIQGMISKARNQNTRPIPDYPGIIHQPGSEIQHLLYFDYYADAKRLKHN